MSDSTLYFHKIQEVNIEKTPGKDQQIVFGKNYKNIPWQIFRKSSENFLVASEELSQTSEETWRQHFFGKICEKNVFLR